MRSGGREGDHGAAESAGGEWGSEGELWEGAHGGDGGFGVAQKRAADA